jgi:hypothetical protein
MKRIGTIWMVLLALGFSFSSSFSQTSQSGQPKASSKLFVGSREVNSSPLRSFHVPILNPPISPLFVEDSLYNYDFVDNNNAFLNWPIGDTLDSAGIVRTAPTGAPYVRFEHCEGFTATGDKPILDSVRMMLQVSQLGVHAGNKIVVSIINQETLPLTDGTLFPFPNPNVSLKSVNILTSKMPLNTIIDTMIKFTNSKGIGGVPIDVSDTLGDDAGSFYVSMSIFYPDNVVSLISDSATDTRDLDPTLDRAAYVAYSTDNMWFTRGIMAGYQSDPNDPSSPLIFPNFIMTAFTHDALASVADGDQKASSLSPNYPNPVSNTTDISYNLAASGPVTLNVYNQLGEQVALVVNAVQGAGQHEVTFNTANLPDGMYFYRLQAGDFVDTKSMVVSK